PARAPEDPGRSGGQRHGQEHERCGEYLGHEETGSVAAVAASVPAQGGARYARTVVGDEALEPAARAAAADDAADAAEGRGRRVASAADAAEGGPVGPAGASSFHALLTPPPEYDGQ